MTSDLMYSLGHQELMTSDLVYSLGHHELMTSDLVYSLGHHELMTWWIALATRWMTSGGAASRRIRSVRLRESMKSVSGTARL